jgi:hypothetical protein
MRSKSSVSNNRPACHLILASLLILLVSAARPSVAQVIICPPDMTVSNDSGLCSAVVDFPTPTVSGTNAGDIVTCDPVSGSTFPVGTNDVTCAVTQAETNLASCSFMVTVNDTEAPVITDVGVSRSLLWPPNHKLVKIAVNYKDHDNCDPAPTCSLAVASNEAVNGLGDGSTSPDWKVVDAHNVMLRAERSGRGNGRIYTITITCTDLSGNSTSTDVTVCVPHDRGRGSDCQVGSAGNNGDSNDTSNGKGKGKGRGNGKG